MPIKTADNVFFLSGHVPIEEAEALHEATQAVEKPTFDLAEARFLHTAIIQVVMASGGTVRGLPFDPVLAACFRERIES